MMGGWGGLQNPVDLSSGFQVHIFAFLIFFLLWKVLNVFHAPIPSKDKFGCDFSLFGKQYLFKKLLI